MAKVISITKSLSWGKEVNGEKRYFAVVSFSKGSGNKFIAGAIGTNSTYKLSFDLKAIYGTECVNDDGEFSPKTAYQKFTQEYDPEGVNLYDVELPRAYKVKATERIMTVARIAIYGTEAEAHALAMRSLERDIKAQRIVPVEPVEESAEEDEDE